jgi:hypothetical protein
MLLGQLGLTTSGSTPESVRFRQVNASEVLTITSQGAVVTASPLIEHRQFVLVVAVNVSFILCGRAESMLAFPRLLITPGTTQLFHDPSSGTLTLDVPIIAPNLPEGIFSEASRQVTTAARLDALFAMYDRLTCAMAAEAESAGSAVNRNSTLGQCPACNASTCVVPGLQPLSSQAWVSSLMRENQTGPACLIADLATAAQRREASPVNTSGGRLLCRMPEFCALSCRRMGSCNTTFSDADIDAGKAPSWCQDLCVPSWRWQDAVSWSSWDSLHAPARQAVASASAARWRDGRCAAANASSASPVSAYVSPVSIGAGWGGAALSEDGSLLVLCPSSARFVLIINVHTGRVVHNVTNAFVQTVADDKWRGAALGRDGRVYCAPYNSANMIAIHPESGTVRTLFDTILGSSARYNTLIALGGTGNSGTLVGIPRTSNSILSVAVAARPATGSTTFADPGISYSGSVVVSGSIGWLSAAVGTNGAVYASPWTAEKVLCVRRDGQPELIGATLPSAERLWSGAVAAPNGAIYMFPADTRIGAALLRITPETNVVTKISIGGWSSSLVWSGAALAQDGFIYAISAAGGQVALRFDCETHATTVAQVVGSLGAATQSLFAGVLPLRNGSWSGVLAVPSSASRLVLADVVEAAAWIPPNMVFSALTSRT